MTLKKMELKRYVLINHLIVDLTKEEVIGNSSAFYRTDLQKGVGHVLEIGERYPLSSVNNLERKVKYDGGVYTISKTSDNILDLVEDGDLIRTTKKLFEVQFSMLDYGKIVAIYKLQPNGDYKKYEVK